MNDTEPSVKLTFHKPVFIDRWTGWEIVVDSLPVADFGLPENSTLKLSEGQHEIYLRHRILPGISSATQKLKVNLAKGDEVTIKLSIDPKLHLFVFFCIVMTFLSFQSQEEAIGHLIQLFCLLIMTFSIFSIVKGFAHRLSIVEPESSLKLGTAEIAQPKKRITADSVVQSLASEFAKNTAIKKATPLPVETTTATRKKLLGDWSYFLMLFGVLIFDATSPMDAVGMVALFFSAVATLFAAKWTKDNVLKIGSYFAYLLASIIGLFVVFSPHLGTLAPAAFLAISLCIGTALALNFGASIAENMKKSKAAGGFSLVINSVLAICVIQLMVPALLQFVAQHI